MEHQPWAQSKSSYWINMLRIGLVNWKFIYFYLPICRDMLKSTSQSWVLCQLPCSLIGEKLSLALSYKSFWENLISYAAKKQTKQKTLSLPPPLPPTALHTANPSECWLPDCPKDLLAWCGEKNCKQENTPTHTRQGIKWFLSPEPFFESVAPRCESSWGQLHLCPESAWDPEIQVAWLESPCETCLSAWSFGIGGTIQNCSHLK